MQRVIAAHDALQLGKLADHPGREVGLGEPRGTGGALGVGAGHVGGESSRRASRCACALSSTLPSLAWKTRSASASTRVVERDLAVLVPEEAGVGEARAQHALVAGDDGLAVVGVRLLATNRKRGAGVPSGCRHEKYFWCVRIAVASTSGGKAM